MSLTFSERISHEGAAYGGFVDAIGGVATVVLAIVGLAGARPETMVAIATIVFGGALLIQGGAIASEYAHIMFPAGVRTVSMDEFSGSSLSAARREGAGGRACSLRVVLPNRPNAMISDPCGEEPRRRGAIALWNRAVAELRRYRGVVNAASNEEVLMTMQTSQRAGTHAQDWINLICGVLLFVSPWAFGFAHEVMAAWTVWVGGVVIAVMGILALVQFAEWEDWVALIAGVLMIIAPWVLGFAALTYAVYTCVVLGIVVAAASVSEIWLVRHPAITAR